MQVIDKVREFDGGDYEVILTIKIDAEEVDAAVDGFFKEYGQREIKGFRKGKAPRAVLEKAAGGHVKAYGGVAEKLINETGFEAIDSENVIFLSEPEFNVDSIPEDHKPFTYTVSGVVKPEIELNSYEPVTVEMPPDEATDDEIQRQIDNLRAYYYTFEAVEGAAEMGNFVNAEITLIAADGGEVPGFVGVERMIELGGSTMPVEFTNALLGKCTGDEVEFDFDPSNEEGYSHLGDGIVHATCKVNNVRAKVLPPIDDALAARVGSTDVDDLYKAMRISINAQKNEQLPAIMEERCIAAAAERIETEIPEGYMTFVRNQVQQDILNKMQKDGTNLQEFMLNNGVDGDRFKEDVASQSKERAIRDLTLDAIARNCCEPVTEEDIMKEFSQSEDLEEVIASWKEANRLSNLREVVARSKAARWLVATADVIVVED